MWIREGAARPVRRRALVLAVVLAAALGVPRSGGAAGYAPSPDEVALLALANEARAKSGLMPYVWHDALGEAALAHSKDMATRGCFQHDSCNGEAWWKRIGRYYPNWTAISENIGGGGTARMMHEAWMSSSGHRANILGSFTEFGAGIVVSASNVSYATEDFGRRGALEAASYPTVPAAAVVPRVGYASEARELLLNYFDGGGAPRAVRALVGTSCVSLSKKVGSASNATYGTTRTFPTAGCLPVVFEVIRADGVRVRWPESEAIVVGTGTASLSCPAWTTDVPTQDCGGGGTTPTPTPTPGPTPVPGELALDAVRITLRPTGADPGTGQVQIQAVLPLSAGFDPTTGPVSLALSWGASGTWTRVVPQTCGAEPCLVANARATVYRWRNGSQATLTFTRGQNQSWRLRYSGRDEPLGALGSGPVRLTVRAGGLELDGLVEGAPAARGIVAR
jgi:hypothetical protein